MTTGSTPKPIETPKSRYARRIAIIVTVIHFIVTLILGGIGQNSQIVSMQYMAGITALITLAGFQAIFLCYRNRHTAGIWRLIIAIWVLIPLLSLFAKGYGWIIVVSIPLAIGLVAGLSLPFNRFGFVMIGSAISGVIGLLIDLFGPDSRSEMPNTAIIIPTAVTLIGLLGVYLLYRAFPGFSLRAKLLTLFLSVALVPLSLFIYVNNSLTRNALTTSAIQSLTLIATQTSGEIDDFIRNNLNLIQNDAQLSIFQSSLELEAENIRTLQRGAVNSLQLLTSKNPSYIRSYTLLNRDGQYFASYPEISGSVPDFMGLNPSITNGLKVLLLSNVPYVSPVFYDQNTGERVIYFAGRTNSPTGEPMGLLVMKMDAAVFQDMVAARNQAAGEQSYGVLFDDHHIILAHGTTPAERSKLVLPLDSNQIAQLQRLERIPNLAIDNLTINAPELDENLDRAAQTPNFTLPAGQGSDVATQVVAAPLLEVPWQIAFFQPQETFLSPVGQQTRVNVIFAVGIIAAVTLAAIQAATVIGAPILDLTAQVEEIAAGNLSIHVPVKTRDEIGRLARSFNSMTSQIRNLLGGLESQVTDRTLEIERRALQLQTAAEVARDASLVQDLDTLLNQTVNLIHNRFGYYHAAIFLIDQAGEYAVLRASNSDGGKQLLRQGHRMRVGGVGIVGDTTETGRPHIAYDVGEDAAFFAQPLLPYTRAEMALPLKVGELIIGALDVQSDKRDAFVENDIEVLQIMADQLAVAIRNSQLLEEQQQIIYELQSAQGDFTRRSWQEFIKRSLIMSGYKFSGTHIEPANQLSEMSQKAIAGRVTITETQNQQSIIAVPILLRNTPIGVINLTVNSSQITPETQNLVTLIAERLSLALDNARLLESTQFQAHQEQLIGEITTRIRETLDVNTVLKTTIREMREHLGLHDVIVELKTPQQ